MSSQNERNQELQRQVEQRLREIESQIHANDAPFHKTVKHQREYSQKPWMKKALLGAKIFAIGVAVLVAVRIASVIAGFMIVAVLVWVTYKLFFESQKR